MFHVEQNLWGVWVIGLTWGGLVFSGEGSDHFAGFDVGLCMRWRALSLMSLSMLIALFPSVDACPGVIFYFLFCANSMPLIHTAYDTH